MPQLTISFDPVAGATGYEVCYKPSGGLTYTCASYAGSPVVISSGIDCGVNYDVTVKTLCANGLESSVVGALATKVECPPTAFCYEASILSEGASGVFVSYQPPGGSPTVEDATTLPLDIDGFHRQKYCSEVAVLLVDGNGDEVTLNNGSGVTGGSVGCTSDTDCRTTYYTAFPSSGLGETACNDQSHTLYSDCANIEVECFLFEDNVGTPLTGFDIVWIEGVLYEVNSTTGQVTGVSSQTC